MKNSAENNAGFSLFSINEHRLSMGLLALLLLAGAGYGIWLVLSPLLPSIAASQAVVSRNQIGDNHYNDSAWPQAIKVYREILDDDPDNGYVILKVATAIDNQLYEKWAQYESLVTETEPEITSAAQEVLAEEAVLFQDATENWNKLLDNTRYRRHAMERVVCLHGLRFGKLNDSKTADKAIELLEEMFDKGYATNQGLLRTRSLIPLRDHRQFSRLVLEERRISNLPSTSTYSRNPGANY